MTLRNTTRLLACLWLLPILAEGAAASKETYESNWPQWRGPSASGVASQGNPPVEWSEERNIKWKARIPGNGHATPVIWEDKLFVLSAVPAFKKSGPQPVGGGLEGAREFGGRRPDKPAMEEHAFVTYALDRATGKILWEKVGRKEVPHEGHQSSNTYASSSPITDGEHVYSYFGSRGLYCYDLNGTLMWEKSFGRAKTRNGFGEGGTPVLSGDVLVVVWDEEGPSRIVALDKRTGNELWSRNREEKTGWTTPFVAERDGRKQVVVNASNAVRSYDLSTGGLLWECGGQTANAIPSVVGDSDMIYVMSGFRGSAAYGIRLGHTGNLAGSDAVVWMLNRGTPYVPSPLLYQGRLYFCQGNDPMISCVEAKTGRVLYSQMRLDGLRGVYASPVGVHDRVYLPGRNGVTAVLESADTLKVLATNKLDDPIDASPAVVGNELFLRGDRHVYCIAHQAR